MDTGTVGPGMIIVLQWDLGQCHDLLPHMMGKTTGDLWVQGRMVGVPELRGIMHRASHWVQGKIIAFLQDLGHDPSGRRLFQCLAPNQFLYDQALMHFYFTLFIVTINGIYLLDSVANTCLN